MTIDVAASTAGGTVGPTVTALMATAGAVTGNPDLVALSVPAGALADAMTEHGLRLVTQTLLNPAERVGRFAEAVTEEAGEPIEDFISEYVTDATEREFLGRVVDAATAARSPWKIHVLARAFVRGAKDGDLIDETEMFIGATRDLEPAHARFLAAAHKIFKVGSYLRGFEILEVDRAIGPAAPLLWRHLRERNLLEAVEVAGGQGQDAFRMTDLGVAVSEWLTELGADLDMPPASHAS